MGQTNRPSELPNRRDTTHGTSPNNPVLPFHRWERRTSIMDVVLKIE
ncbi:MAG: hypothetical protein AAGE59_09355 [Cyanobacteria bacterium P01_F01_bin.86]